LRRIELLRLIEAGLETWVQEHRITPRDHQIVKFRLGGMSHGEIAEILGMTQSNVAQRFTRLRQSLRRALEGAGINYLDASE
jgi:RNA polymerase sigma factor (sigma-70 family)